MSHEGDRPRNPSGQDLLLIQLDADRIVADETLDHVETAFAGMLEDRRKTKRRSLSSYETKRTHEGGVHSLIFRWPDGDISKNVEALFRRNENPQVNQWKLAILIHAWRKNNLTGDSKQDALVPTTVVTLYRPPFDERVLKHGLSLGFTRISNWRPR